MQVKATKFIGATRTIKVPLAFEDGDERKTEEFIVKFRSFSPKVAREMAELEAAEGANIARSLASMIVSIPEITNGEGQPLKITEEILDQMAADNLEALYKAITSAVRPTVKGTSADSPSTSPPAAGQA